MIPASNFPPNCGNVTSVFTWTHNKQKISARAFDIIATEIRRVNQPGSTTNLAVKDQNVIRNSSAGYVTDFRVNRVIRRPNYYLPISFSSGDVGVLTDPPSSGANAGIATYVSSGNTFILATSPDGEIASVAVQSRQVFPATVDVFDSWVEGSLAEHCTTAVNSRLAGKSSSDLAVFSTRNHSAESYVRSSTFWGADIDFTCASVWNSTGGNQRAGVLISPRHVLFCAHSGFYPSINAQMRFVTNDNQLVKRTLTALTVHPSYVPFFPDLAVGCLNEDVPNTIGFSRILPNDWATKLPNLNPATPLPAIRFNQSGKAVISELHLLSVLFSLQFPASKQSFYESAIVGDSGSPCFIVVNNQPVLLGVLTTGGAGTGTFVTQQREAINNIMTAQGGGYNLAEVDLASFPTY
jgi:hypothetical protein